MLSPIKANLGEKLKNKAYRTKFFRNSAQYELAFQLRSARKRRKLTQPKLEKLSGMKQSAISRIEQASYPHWNFQSLLCLADALDQRVRVVLEDAEDVIREYEQIEAAGKNPFYVQSSDAGAGPSDLGVQCAMPAFLHFQNQSVPNYPHHQ